MDVVEAQALWAIAAVIGSGAAAVGLAYLLTWNRQAPLRDEAYRWQQDAYGRIMEEETMRQLEHFSGRNRLDIAVNGFPPLTPSPSRKSEGN